ncbi:MAG: cell division protein FtsA [Bdellovibrionaceae bacterium]|jgi:cell division protein FtsA|nr:cell division protein FtsA [Pseudobdellovibrionaceae bacterium]
MSNIQQPIIAGIDVGTTKVAVVIGHLNEDKELNIVGVGQAANQGVKQGHIVNIDMVSEAIKKAKEEAEFMAGVNIETAYISVGGPHINSFSSSGMVAIKNNEVNAQDVEKVIETARAVAIPSDIEVLHVIPNEFKIDSQGGIIDPIGMSGVRLETDVHIITGQVAVIQNYIKCVEKAGIKVKGTVLQPLATAMSIVTEDEKNLGVGVVDMGGGACHIIAFNQGGVIKTSMIPIGGANVTQDISMGLKTTQANAESIKKKYACALPELVEEGESIEVESVGGQKQRIVSKKELCQIVEARVEETLNIIKDTIDKLDLNDTLGSGLVISGGASQLTGVVEMCEFAFELPVRLGTPRNISGLTDVVKLPQFATAVGILFYIIKEEKLENYQPSSREMIAEQTLGMFDKVKNYFNEVF